MTALLARKEAFKVTLGQKPSLETGLGIACYQSFVATYHPVSARSKSRLLRTLGHGLDSELEGQMADQEENENRLTASECAARTGLTIRALRVYERHGLISPARATSGWRQYGSRELIRLNTVCVLKAAGLTLAQIRAALREAPALRMILQ